MSSSVRAEPVRAVLQRRPRPSHLQTHGQADLPRWQPSPCHRSAMKGNWALGGGHGMGVFLYDTPTWESGCQGPLPLGIVPGLPLTFPPCGPAASSWREVGPETSGNPSLLDSRPPLANTQETAFGSGPRGGHSEAGREVHKRTQAVHQLSPGPLAQEGTVLAAVEGDWHVSALTFWAGLLTAAERWIL